MPVDALMMTALAAELGGELTGGKVDKIFQPTRDEIHLAMRGRTGNVRLLISAGARHPRAHLTTVTRENPSMPPMFCMLLRKHLLGARLLSLTQPPLERVLQLRFDCVDELGERSEKTLVCELMGRHSNVILVGSDGRIVDCLRRVDSEMSEKRQVLPGLYYELPPGTGKLDPMAAAEDQLIELWTRKPAEEPGDGWLLRTFAGLSPLVCREMSFGGLPESLFQLREAYLAGHFLPYLLTLPTGGTDVSCLPVDQYGPKCAREAVSFSALLDEAYTFADAAEQLRQRAQSLQKTAENNRDRAARKRALQERELVQAKDRTRLRELGDLLMANLHAVRRGATEVVVEDFYAPDGGKAVIPLDPQRTPQQNAAKYYKDHAKAKNAETVLTIEIQRAMDAEKYWESVVEEIGRAAGEKELQEIRDEVFPGGTAVRKKRDKPLPPHAFVSSTGMRFYAGRNNRQNDELTFKLASRGDLWLHAQKIPGCHVIVDCASGQPDETTLLEAATVAATLSQGTRSPKVEVDYAAVRHVKKPPDARPGMVIYDRFKTVLVSPDAVIVERLKAT